MFVVVVDKEGVVAVVGDSQAVAVLEGNAVDDDAVIVAEGRQGL